MNNIRHKLILVTLTLIFTTLIGIQCAVRYEVFGYVYPNSIVEINVNNDASNRSKLSRQLLTKQFPNERMDKMSKIQQKHKLVKMTITLKNDQNGSRFNTSAPQILILIFKFKKAPYVISNDFFTDIYDSRHWHYIDARIHHGWVKLQYLQNGDKHKNNANPSAIDGGEKIEFVGKHGNKFDYSTDDFQPFNDVSTEIYEVVLEYTKKKMKAIFTDKYYQYILEPYKPGKKGIHIVKRIRRHSSLSAIYHEGILDYLPYEPMVRQHKTLKVARKYITGPYVIEGVFFVTKVALDTSLNYLPYIACQLNSIFRHFSIEANIQFQLKGIKNYPVNKVITDDWNVTINNFIRSRVKDSSMDVAILISNKITKKSPIVGLAPLGKICDVEKSVVNAYDMGLDTAQVIGHEIGHLMGCLHDMDNGCTWAKRGIMHYFSQGFRRFTWSECCVAEIHNTLRSSRSDCLLKKQNYELTMNTQKYPGKTMFDKQCQINYGVDYFINLQESNCNILVCINSTQFGTNNQPPLDGTSCTIDGGKEYLSQSTTGKICLHGKCIEERKIPKFNKGSWGHWSKWSSCKGFCPLGYQTRKRYCKFEYDGYNLDYCVGDKHEHKICHKSCGLYEQGPKAKNQYLCSTKLRNSTYSPNIDCNLCCFDGKYIIGYSTFLADGTPINNTTICVEGTPLTI